MHRALATVPIILYRLIALRICRARHGRRSIPACRHASVALVGLRSLLNLGYRYRIPFYIPSDLHILPCVSCQPRSGLIGDGINLPIRNDHIRRTFFDTCLRTFAGGHGLTVVFARRMACSAHTIADSAVEGFGPKSPPAQRTKLAKYSVVFIDTTPRLEDSHSVEYVS